MTRPQRITDLSVSLLLLVASTVYFSVWYAFHTVNLEQLQLFEGTWAYFAETVSVPGGFSDYLGRFLTQFFYHACPPAADLHAEGCHHRCGHLPPFHPFDDGYVPALPHGQPPDRILPHACRSPRRQGNPFDQSPSHLDPHFDSGLIPAAGQPRGPVRRHCRHPGTQLAFRRRGPAGDDCLPAGRQSDLPLPAGKAFLRVELL